MAEALCLFLAQKEDVCQVGDAKALLQHLGLGGVCLQIALQLKGVVKVVLHNALAAPGDDKNFFNACGHGLFHDILNGGLIHNGQHLFGHGLRGGQHARAQACGGDDGFAYFVHVLLPSFFILKPPGGGGKQCYRMAPFGAL